MEYRVGDHYGLPTRVVQIQTNGSERSDFFKYLHEAPPDFDPRRGSAGRARGSFVVKVTAPPHAHIAWLSVGGSFVTHQQRNAQGTRNTIAYALEEAKDFRPLYRAAVPSDQSHWHYNVDREVRLDRPAKIVYLRYEGDPGVNNLQIYAHCLDERPRRRGHVTITHAWAENGTAKTQTVTLDQPGSYEVIAPTEPANEYVQIAVPNGRAR
jgi:hypothetical protein